MNFQFSRLLTRIGFVLGRVIEGHNLSPISTNTKDNSNACQPETKSLHAGPGIPYSGNHYTVSPQLNNHCDETPKHTVVHIPQPITGLTHRTKIRNPLVARKPRDATNTFNIKSKFKVNGGKRKNKSVMLEAMEEFENFVGHQTEEEHLIHTEDGRTSDLEEEEPPDITM
ncbi:OLC1v1020564C1 [Oldenlandia corymbosa var. corymbosa]|uniref:OLC1v1020564C1 n=1 Tax=Oldenlandia corymbosa var. corymbosa TaxID=529605 RepID=A0AAV1EH08_OLDCO|nr:OLC1v1020564C1 [Oldenlandia corymbosa var. corymbosa]